MTTHIETLRTALHARIRLAAEARRTARTKPTACEHSWQRFKQTIVAEDRPKWHTELPGARPFTGDAWFVLMGCTRCKAKVLVDHVVEAGRI